MNTLGIIGGLGPMATVYFMQMLTQMSDAETDQEHMDILMCSKPSIPDRTQYILGKSNKSPVPEMIQAGRMLKRMGADIIAIPCITAHYFHGELENGIGLPVINAITETARYFAKKKISRIGILATDGTIRSGMFQKALKAYGIQSLVPEEAGQREVMSIIYDEVKAGKTVDIERFKMASDELFSEGAQVILLGCTELSLVKRDFALPAGYFDVMELLAGKALKCCGYVRKEYEELIT